MQQVQLINTSPAELIEEIRKAIIPQLKEELGREFQPKEPTELMTREEVAQWLKTDLSTLWRWTKKGKLTAYGMGSRVYYKRSEIENSLEKI